MDASFQQAATLVDKAYVEQGETALKRRQALVKTLLSQRKLPSSGFDDASIEQLLQVGIGWTTLAPVFFFTA